MSGKKIDVSAELVEAFAEMADYAEGKVTGLRAHTVQVPEDVDVKAIREDLGLKRPEFCRRFGLDVRAVQDWEQHRRRPDRAARALLLVIKHNPAAVEAALQA